MKGLVEKVRKGEGGFTLIELLIVIIILGVLAAVVAFNVGGFLGQGTEETAKTEMASVQTALLAGMADVSAGAVAADTLTNADDNKTVTTTGAPDFDLATYLHLPTHGNWHWTTGGIIDAGAYEGGGTCCDYTTAGGWTCTDGQTCGNATSCS